MADPELTKAFAEHQAKMIETSSNMQRIQQQIEELNISVKRSQITDREISHLPDGVKVYESIGRLFMLTPTDEVLTHIKTDRDESSKKIQKLQKEKGELEQALKRSEESIRELVSQKRKL
jgi:prefoldin subunit 1